MKRPVRVEHFRWLGDKRNQRVYDLDEVIDESVIDELMASEQYLVFGPDTLAEARNRGYRQGTYRHKHWHMSSTLMGFH